MTHRKLAAGAGALALACSCTRQPHVIARTPIPSAVEQTMVRQIDNAVDAGDGDYQTRKLRERLVDDPNNLSARLALADRYWKAGIPELTIEHYRFAAEKFPDDAKVAMLLARALRDFDRAPQAISTLAGFCNRNAKQPVDLLSLLGILEDDAGDFVEAENAYRAALAQSPERGDVRNNLGYNLLLQGKQAEAVEQLEAALKIDPRSQIAHNNLGVALLARWTDDAQPKEALLHWQSVSDPATAHNNLATILIEQKRYAEARQELEYALGYQKDHEVARRNLKLVSQLDGRAAVPELTARNSFWKRVKTVITTRKQSAAVVSAANIR